MVGIGKKSKYSKRKYAVSFDWLCNFLEDTSLSMLFYMPQIILDNVAELPVFGSTRFGFLEPNILGHVKSCYEEQS